MPPRGPRPLPTSVKVLHGTQRKDRTNTHEPRPAAGIPACPDHLGAEAKKEWARLSKELLDLGLLTKVDRGALALYCAAWGRWVEAEQALRKHGVLVKSPSGYPMQSPYLAIANKAMEQMRALLTEFGMSPSSRARVHALPVDQEEGGMAAFLREVGR